MNQRVRSSRWHPLSRKVPPPDKSASENHILVGQPAFPTQPLRKSTSPIAELLRSSLAFCTLGKYLRFEPTFRKLSVLAAALTISLASSGILARGFSHQTCLPRLSAPTAMGLCSLLGTETTTKSTSRLPTAVSQSGWKSQPISLLNFFAASTSLSERHTSSVSVCPAIDFILRIPILPQPITANLSL